MLDPDLIERDLELITVAAVLVISRALRNAGVVDLAVRLLAPLRGRPTVQLAAQSSIIALLSAFMNNVGAMALMLPVALRNAYRDGYAPALVLMPLAFASLLGGLTTLIGTPPNIIIATFRAEHAGVPFAMFDYSPVGLVVALAGLVFVSLIGWRLIPLDRRGQSDPAKLFEIDNYVAEAEVVQGTEAVGQSIQELEALAENDMTIAGLFRGERRNLVPSGYERVRADDVLVLEGDPTALTSLIEAAKLKLVSSDKPLGEGLLRSDDVGLAEAVILPGSSILARSARAARLRTIHRVNLLALARHGTEIHQRLSNVRFQVGDVLLLQGATETLPETLQADYRAVRRDDPRGERPRSDGRRGADRQHDRPGNRGPKPGVGAGGAVHRHYVHLGRHQQQRDRGADRADRDRARRAAERCRRSVPDGDRAGRELCLPDTDRPSVEHAGDGAGRLSLRRLLAHGAAARSGDRGGRHPNGAVDLAAVTRGLG